MDDQDINKHLAFLNEADLKAIFTVEKGHHNLKQAVENEVIKYNG